MKDKTPFSLITIFYKTDNLPNLWSRCARVRAKFNNQSLNYKVTTLEKIFNE